MMKFRFHIIICALIALLGGCKQLPTNWTEHYKETSKDPFGLYVLENEADQFFDEQKVTLLRQNIYDYLYDRDLDEENDFNYLCIKNDIDKTSSDGIQEILLHVENGSTAFISLVYFNEYLREELNFEVGNSRFYKNDSFTQTRSGVLSLTNEDFNDTTYAFDRNLNLDYFSSYDETSSIVLGTHQVNGEERPNFLKVYYGLGIVYLHTEPIVFTNYYLLNGKQEYAENALSYLSEDEILWDPQRRYSTIDGNDNNDATDTGSASSIFGFFWSDPSLKWFLYILFSGLIIFLLFNARRKQRPIPVIDPPKNSTLEFTHTISNLYLLNEEHQNVAEKKIQYFLEKVRSRYYLDTSNLNSDFIKKLTLKSGNDLETTERLIQTILSQYNRSYCSPEELMQLNKLIDNYLKPKSHGRTK
jgi:hypothetical protein